jgi:hypothetical protein
MSNSCPVCFKSGFSDIGITTHVEYCLQKSERTKETSSTSASSSRATSNSNVAKRRKVGNHHQSAQPQSSAPNGKSPNAALLNNSTYRLSTSARGCDHEVEQDAAVEESATAQAVSCYEMMSFEVRACICLPPHPLILLWWYTMCMLAPEHSSCLIMCCVVFHGCNDILYVCVVIHCHVICCVTDQDVAAILADPTRHISPPSLPRPSSSSSWPLLESRLRDLSEQQHASLAPSAAPTRHKSALDARWVREHLSPALQRAYAAYGLHLPDPEAIPDRFFDRSPATPAATPAAAPSSDCARYLAFWEVRACVRAGPQCCVAVLCCASIGDATVMIEIYYHHHHCHHRYAGQCTGR